MPNGFDNTSLAPLIQIRCASLRSKSPYGVFGEYDEEILDSLSSTTSFWCLRSMSRVGPDEHFVHRHNCVEGRRCWHMAD